MLIPAIAFARPSTRAGVFPPGFELHQIMAEMPVSVVSLPF